MSTNNAKNLTLTAIELFEQKNLYIGKLLCFVSEEKEKFFFLFEITRSEYDLYSIHSLKKTSIMHEFYYQWAKFIMLNYIPAKTL